MSTSIRRANSTLDRKRDQQALSHGASASVVTPPLDEEPVPRRAVAAALGALGLFALSGCAAQTSSQRESSKSQGGTGRSSQALLVGATATDSIAELRSANISYDQAVYVQGYYAPGDGGEGHFWCNTADTTSADDGGLIIVDGLDQRWYRLTDDTTLSVRWFGALGNGGSDDTSAIQAAINAAQNIAPRGGAVRFPPGAYYTTGTLSCTAPIALVGNVDQPEAASIIPSTMNFDVIDVHEVGFGTYIRGLTIGPPAELTGGGGHGIRVTRCHVVDIEFVNIYTTYNGFINDSSGSVYLRRVIIRPANLSATGRYGVMVTGLSVVLGAGGNANSTECHNVLIRPADGIYNRNVDGFIFCDGYNSLTMHDSGAFECNRRLWMTCYLTETPPAFLVEESGTSDHNNIGWEFQNGAEGCVVQLVNCLCTSSFSENIFVHDTYAGNLQFTGCHIAKSGGYSTSGEGAGFRLAGSGNYVLSGCTVDFTGGHNVLVTNSSAAISIIGGTFSRPGTHAGGYGPDLHSFHIHASAGGSLSLAGINQHNAARGMYDGGSTCLIHGHALFTVNSITGINITANQRKSPAAPPHSAVWYP